MCIIIEGLNSASDATAVLLYTVPATFPGNHITLTLVPRVAEGSHSIPGQQSQAPLLGFITFSNCFGLRVLK